MNQLTPLLVVYPKKMKTLICKDRCTHTFTAALFTITTIQKQSKCPSIDEQLKKMWCIHLFYGWILLRWILLSHKKEWKRAISDNMNIPWRYDAKWNELEKGKYYMTTYMWNLRNKPTNKRTNRLKYKEQTSGCQRRCGWGIKGANFQL